MIEPKELRIGNLIAPIGYGVSTCLVTGVSDDGVFVSGVPGMGLLDFDEVDPIPITPEWIKRFGWASNGYGRYESEPYIQYPTLAYDERSGLIGYNLHSSVCDWMGHIKHIHQLQNLWHSLTGTELTVKEPTKTEAE